MRSDGVGPIGSSDPCALTEFDAKVVPVDLPRMKGFTPPPCVLPPNGGQTQDGEAMMLTPEEWRREFERTWPGRA